MSTRNIPLAERMRPETLDEVVGQRHLIGEGKPLSNIAEKGILPSIIFWGPPGVGKTTLARILASGTGKTFFTLSAISAGVKDIREIIDLSKKAGGAVLFIDEIHRFNKSQQDSLLGAVESGDIILIGATTENPSFEVNSALLSRSQVYVLEELGKDDLLQLAQHAIATDEVLKGKQIELKETEALLKLSGGDARKLLNVLEIAINAAGGKKVVVTDKLVMDYAQRKMAMYDKAGEMHYDVISAFIKSIRGSDPNAALYYMARMIEGGEDPKFIARRLVILASEDIGNANPNALLLATACFQAVNLIGYPECALNLAQTTVYLASSAKSNASYEALKAAQALVKKTGDLPVPLHLRNAPTKLMKDLNYGKDYQYAHGFEGNFIEMEFLPEKIAGTTLYEPGDNPREQELRANLKKWWKGKYGY
ncbi:MAG: replication-associated recombination protein A [Chitinophagales bacterium]|nr:replication-associated recombination protein A [Chitinophagales bacterium]